MEDGSHAVGLFNRGQAEAPVSVSWKELGLKGPQKRARPLAPEGPPRLGQLVLRDGRAPWRGARAPRPDQGPLSFRHGHEAQGTPQEGRTLLARTRPARSSRREPARRDRKARRHSLPARTPYRRTSASWAGPASATCGARRASAAVPKCTRSSSPVTARRCCTCIPSADTESAARQLTQLIANPFETLNVEPCGAGQKLALGSR